MRSRLSIPAGRFRGVPIRIHLSFLLLLAFLFWRTGTALGVRAAAAELLLLIALFACVVLHEMGHTAVALRFGLPISEITLYPFGGVAALGRRPRGGREELLIAAAGPAVNLALAVGLLVATAGGVLARSQLLPMQLMSFLFWSNLIIAAFNLLPAFPLDGGRVLRAALAPGLGWSTATIWAASAGQVVAVALMISGVLGRPWLLLAGAIIFPGANNELRLALALRALARRRVREVMAGDIDLVRAEATLEDLARWSRDVPMRDFVIQDGGSIVGFLSAARLWSLMGSPEPAVTTAGRAAMPLASSVAPGAPLEEVLERLRSEQVEAAPVIDDDGRVVGVITKAAIDRAMSMTRILTARGQPTEST